MVWSLALIWVARFAESAVTFEHSFAFVQSSELRTAIIVIGLFWVVCAAMATYVAVDVYIGAIQCGINVTPTCFDLVYFVYQVLFVLFMITEAVICIVQGASWREACETIYVRNEMMRAEYQRQRKSLHRDIRARAHSLISAV